MENKVTVFWDIRRHLNYELSYGTLQNSNQNLTISWILGTYLHTTIFAFPMGLKSRYMRGFPDAALHPNCENFWPTPETQPELLPAAWTERVFRAPGAGVRSLPMGYNADGVFFKCRITTQWHNYFAASSPGEKVSRVVSRRSTM